MLFKNLPTLSLILVIPSRLILDGLAAIMFLKQSKGLKHFLAIVEAHFSFYSSIPKLLKKRQKINQRNNLSGKMNWSILYKNRISGVKYFSSL